MSSNIALKPVAGTKEQVEELRVELASTWNGLLWLGFIALGGTFLGVKSLFEGDGITAFPWLFPAGVLLVLWLAWLPTVGRLNRTAFLYKIGKKGLSRAIKLNGRLWLPRRTTPWEEIASITEDGDAVVLHHCDGKILRVPIEAFCSKEQRELLLSHDPHHAAV